MDLELATPDVAALGRAVRVLAGWQRDDVPLQLHPGDLGWAWRQGADALAATVRTWSAGGRLVALGFLDAPALLRLTTDPDLAHDPDLVGRLVEDLGDAGRGVLPDGEVAVETPTGSGLADGLLAAGWAVGEAWSPLRRDLSDPVPDPGVRVEVVGPTEVPAYVAVHRSAFPSSRLDESRWRTMTAGPAYAAARALLLRDDAGEPVAAAVVWSAGPGRPGLLEPVGVHADHRRRGLGRAVSLAAAAARRELGASQALVCTPSSNVAAVTTYASAGFDRLPERHDRARPATTIPG